MYALSECAKSGGLLPLTPLNDRCSFQKITDGRFREMKPTTCLSNTKPGKR